MLVRAFKSCGIVGRTGLVLSVTCCCVSIVCITNRLTDANINEGTNGKKKEEELVAAALL